MNHSVLVLVVAFVVSAALTPTFRSLALRSGYLDVPNEFSSHARPTPRTGGYAILLGFVSAALLATGAVQGVTGTILLCTIALAILAFVDDWYPLPRTLRLVLQIAIAAVAARILLQGAAFASIHSGVIKIALWAVATLWLVALVNIYNFMDGLNGVASVPSIIAAGSLAVLAHQRGDVSASEIAIAMGAATAGFVPYNVFTGSVFMGDAGSTLLGFGFGSLALLASATPMSVLVTVLPLLPFVLDAGSTIVRRALQGEQFFSTRHRSNHYQLLQQQGWTHSAVAALYSVLTLAAAILALSFEKLPPLGRAVALLSFLLLHAVLFAGVRARWFAISHYDSEGSDGH